MRCALQARTVLVGLLLLAGCATQPKATTWFGPEFSGRSGLTYAVLPFADANQAKYKRDYPEAAAVVAAALETAFLQTGQRVVSPGNEEVSLVGTVTAFYRGASGDAYTTVAFNVKAIDTKTEAILWTASHGQTTKWEYKYDPSLWAKEVATALVAELVASGKLR